MQHKIEAALAALTPSYLAINDESHMHSVGEHSHFKVVVVSDVFADMRPVQRQQKVYGLLGDLMQQIHGLAMHTYTPVEWGAVNQAPDSPQCQGGGLLDS